MCGEICLHQTLTPGSRCETVTATLGKITPSALIERKRLFKEKLVALVEEQCGKLLARKGRVAERASDTVDDIEPAGDDGPVCLLLRQPGDL